MRGKGYLFLALSLHGDTLVILLGSEESYTGGSYRWGGTQGGLRGVLLSDRRRRQTAFLQYTTPASTSYPSGTVRPLHPLPYPAPPPLLQWEQVGSPSQMWPWICNCGVDVWLVPPLTHTQEAGSGRCILGRHPPQWCPRRQVDADWSLEVRRGVQAPPGVVGCWRTLDAGCWRREEQLHPSAADRCVALLVLVPP